MNPEGIDAVRRLVETLGLRGAQLPPAPAGWHPVFIAGDQLSGKSTAARLLAERLGADVVSGGSVVRSMAKAAEVTVEEMSRRMETDPQRDVQIDLGLITAATERRSVVECRMAGWLGLALQAATGRPSLRVLLECAPQERAFRWLRREYGVIAGSEARATVERSDCGALDLEAAILDAVRLTSSSLDVPTASVLEAARRDHGDRRRLLGLYGVAYDDTSAFDAVIDVTLLPPVAVAGQLEALVSLGKGGLS